MFSPDVVNLREFYASFLGLQAQRWIADGLHQFWPQAAGDTTLSIGFSAPYFDKYMAQGGGVFICMPASQGAAYWPPSQDNRVFLANESELPLQENSVNRVLLMHSVENSEQLSWMMKEIWRVLTPGGRVLAVVPNRHGMWSRSSRSPFGYGRPFSLPQLRDLMTTHQFTPTRSSSALFLPPLPIKTLWKAAPFTEKLGRFLCTFFGGVLLVEAEKQIYAAIKQPVQVRQPLRAPVPAARPVMSME